MASAIFTSDISGTNAAIVRSKSGTTALSGLLPAVRETLCVVFITSLAILRYWIQCIALGWKIVPPPAAYCLASSKLPILIERPFVCGPLDGIAVHLFMTFIDERIPHPVRNSYRPRVGPPIALTARYFLKK